MEKLSLVDFVRSRGEGTMPAADLEALGYPVMDFLQELEDNPELCYNTIDLADGDLGIYAMVWFTWGACMQHEKEARNATPDDFPA